MTDGPFEFKLDRTQYVRRVASRVLVDIFVLIVLGLLFITFLETIVLFWMKSLVLGIVAIDLASNVFDFVRADTFVKGFSIVLYRDAVGVKNRGKMRQIPYSNLSISQVKRNNEEVVSIKLKIRHASKIKIKGLENMDRFYRLLSDRVSKQTDQDVA